MSNEISIVVRVQNAASRGFDRIGQAAVGMNAAIDAAGSALESIDAIQQSGANKAAKRAQSQNDVNQAMLDSEQAANDLKQATIDANQAQLDATQAQNDYNEAVKKFGANSEEAKQAQADLSQAQADSTQATTDMKQAQIDATQAQIDLNAAQRELNPTAVQQASQKFQELAPAIGLAAIAAQSFGSIMNVTRIRTIATAAATRTMAVAQRLLNIAMRMNPIGLVITALLLLATGLVMAYKRSATFRAIVQGAFAATKAAASAMLSVVRAVLNSLGGLLSSAGSKARTFLSVSRAAFNSVASVVRSVVGKIRSSFGGLYAAITNPVRSAVNAVNSWLNGLLNFASSIPGRIGNSIKGAIPGFAHGGVVGQAASGATSSGLTMTGEHGPELLSLPPGTRVRSNPDTRRMGGLGGGGVAAVSLEVKSGGSKLDDLLVELLRRSIRAGGGNVQAVLGRN